MSEAARQSHLQRLFQRKLTQTATISAPGGEPAVDEGGGYTPAAPSSIEVPCRVGPLGRTPQELAIAAQYSAVSLWVIKVPPGTVIPATAVIEVDGQRYEVVVALGPRTLEIIRRIVCKRIGEA